MKITIFGKFPTLNEYIQAERSHKMNGARIKKEMTELVQWQVINCKPIIELVNINFSWYTKRRADHDNISFAKKFILDGLVRAGILKNDNPKYVNNFTDKFYKTKAEEYCVVEFEKVKE